MPSKACLSISGPTRCRSPADRRSAAGVRPISVRHELDRRSISCTNNRRSEVQRWPQVPTALNRIARSREIELGRGATIMALLPPSSSSERPSRAATAGDGSAHARGAGGAHHRNAAIFASASPRSRRQCTTWRDLPARRRIASPRARTEACVASAVSGVFSLGFHNTESPHTSASAAFQLHTATGKLKAEMTPPARWDATAPSCDGRGVRWRW